MVTSTKRKGLTKRQQEMFEFLKDRIINHNYGPTIREIGDHFDIKSPNGVMCHLKALERKGLISRESNMSRAICLSDESNHRLSLPYIGTAVSGRPIQAAVSSDECVDFDQLFNGASRACIRVRGKDFKLLGIHNGDYIVVDRDGSASPDCLIAALDAQHRLALFRIETKGGQPVPATPGQYSASTRQVLGTVVGVIRHFLEKEPADDE